MLQVQHRYFLLVVLTASAGDDLDAFREALRQASADLALSIVVLGIGGADFRPLQVVPPRGLILRMASRRDNMFCLCPHLFAVCTFACATGCKCCPIMCVNGDSPSSHHHACATPLGASACPAPCVAQRGSLIPPQPARARREGRA